jgi:uncharacterized spore protein YtfJ
MTSNRTVTTMNDSDTSTSTSTASKTKETQAAIFDQIRGSRDAITVKRVFGESYEVDGVTIIPVARASGGAGGGGGEGTDSKEPSGSGSGFGTGYGFGVRPLGVYEVRDGQVEWRPAVDINRVIQGGQTLAGLLAICLTILLWSRR